MKLYIHFYAKENAFLKKKDVPWLIQKFYLSATTIIGST
ncbi:hypothetical protein NMS_2438 [Nonlabens marinus S1-08]|uniref:Uncharacterized protein n=1 Tax=Nonlabens marinus S1-08 TaxID=1454201 RepID=W8VXS7_9FLAO|nr:hypothetical protein NMS_2438 [Nonlabens marinus S1-08]